MNKDPSAKHNFADAQSAYEILIDPEKKEAWCRKNGYESSVTPKEKAPRKRRKREPYCKCVVPIGDLCYQW
jgi:DnaJ-class molecular chaperone